MLKDALRVGLQEAINRAFQGYRDVSINDAIKAFDQAVRNTRRDLLERRAEEMGKRK